MSQRMSIIIRGDDARKLLRAMTEERMICFRETEDGDVEIVIC